MTIEIKVPAMGESVTEATISKWFKKEGDAVKRDEPLLELETDKVTVEVPSPADGAIESIAAQAGATVSVGALLGAIAEGKGGAAAAKPAAPRPKGGPPKVCGPPPPCACLQSRGARHAVGSAHCRRDRSRDIFCRRHWQGRPSDQGRHAGCACRVRLCARGCGRRTGGPTPAG